MSLGVLGTALFFCDALITPAISVLSAVEGLELLDPGLHQHGAAHHRGHHHRPVRHPEPRHRKVGRMFGPVMLVWFALLGVLGALRHRKAPAGAAGRRTRVYGLALLVAHPVLALVILGTVFLAVTGGEALYADMGHFGRLPVRMAWFGIVWPGLLLNYFGQGALLLRSATPVSSTLLRADRRRRSCRFLIVLATAATIIASQATISGAFSVARQAVQLDLLPRLMVLQTSAHARGQIYVPSVNMFMLVSVLIFVFAFGSSSALAAAYGAAVVGTMLLTTCWARWSPRLHWNWATVARRAGVRQLPAGGPGLRARQRHQDPAWRLGATGHRGCDVLRVRHLARRPHQRCAPSCIGARCARGTAEAAGQARRAFRAPPCSWSATPATCPRRCCATWSTTTCATSAS